MNSESQKRMEFYFKSFYQNILTYAQLHARCDLECAEEITMEAYAVLCRKDLSKFSDEKAVLVFLLRTVDILIKRIQAAKARFQEVSLEDALDYYQYLFYDHDTMSYESDATELMLYEEYRKVLARALTPKEWEILVICEKYDVSSQKSDEIANRFGVTKVYARKLISRLKSKVRRILEEEFAPRDKREKKEVKGGRP